MRINRLDGGKVMFEIVTKYNKEIFCKCYKVYYKVSSKYNAKKHILLTIMCFVLATIALILGITKPETFHTVFVSVFILSPIQCLRHFETN